MLGGIGIPELLVIFLIVLLFFGAKRLPEIGSSLGKGIREFKDSISGVEKEINREIPSGESRPSQPSPAPERPEGQEEPRA